MLRRLLLKKSVYGKMTSGTAYVFVGAFISILSGCEAQVKAAGATNSGAPSTLDLTAAFPGSKTYAGISSSLTASDVCSTKNFLGVPGSANCSVGGSISTIVASMAFRSDNATINLASSAAVDARVRATLADEVAGNATFVGNYALVPNPHVDTDGRFDDTGVGVKRNFLETVKGRPNRVCGLSGTDAERISDCATQNTTSGVNKALYEGGKYGQNGEGDWKLLTLYTVGGNAGDLCAGGAAAGCYEVWRDERTQLIWSDRQNNNGNNWNWFQAAGYAKNASTQADTLYEGGTPAATGLTYDVTQCSDPTTYTCQSTIPISVCADAGVIAGLNGIATYQNPDGTGGTSDERPAKGNLTGASRQWRLPTIEDYKLADANGLRKVLPNMDSGFWSASSYSNHRDYAWNYFGYSGLIYYVPRINGSGVRCIGR